MSDCAVGAAPATLGPVKGLDRREFIARGVLLALSAAGLPRLAAPAAASAAAPGLAPVRLATYRRLVEALRLAPDARFAHRDAVAAARAFASAYGAGDEAARSHADAVLDAVAPLLGAPGGAAGRYAALRPGPGGGSPAPAEAHKRAVVMAAVVLVEGPSDQREPTEGLA